MRERGFSLLEILVVVLIFTVITGAVFQLLLVTQQQHKIETEFLASFQDARLAMDQMVRDLRISGYPPISKVMTAVATANPELFAYPMAWSPGYPAASCQVGGGCAIPENFDLILEADLNPEAVDGVEWVRYRLRGTTLFRGVATKTAGGDPVAATAANLVAYIENVINDPNQVPGGDRALLQEHYPNLWAGGAVPVFRYGFGANPTGTPEEVVEVHITLMVMAPNPDPRTGQPRVVTLTGLAHRYNP